MAESDDEPLAELRLQRHRDLVGRRLGPLVVRGIVVTLTDPQTFILGVLFIRETRGLDIIN